MRGILLRIAAAVVLLVAAALAYVLHDLDGKVRGALLDGARDLEAHLGRRVTLGAVHVALGLVTEVVVRDVAVQPPEGAAGELAVPLIRIEETRLAVALGPLLRTWGRHVEVTRFAVDGAEINVVRTPEGLSIDDLRARFATLPKRPPPKGTLALRSLSIKDAKVRFHDLGSPAGDDLVVAPITIEGRDLGPAAPSHLAIGAAVFAPAKNLAIDLDLAPAPSGGVALTRAEVRATSVRPAPLLRWLKAASPALDAAALDAAVTVEPRQAIAVKGTATLSGLMAPSGTPTAIALAADATLDPSAATLAVREVEVSAGDLTVHGSLGAHDLGGTPALDAIDLEARGDAAAIRALLPADRLPPALSVRGPIAVTLHGTGTADDARADVKVDLADVRAIDDRGGQAAEGKPAAVSLSTQLALSRASRSVRVSGAVLKVGDLVVKGDADIRGLGESPAIESLSIDARGPSEAILDMIPAPRRPPGVSLRGPLRVELSAQGKAGDVRGSLAIDLDGASVQARGLSKPAGVPLGAAMDGTVAGGRLQIDHGEVRFGSLAVTASGWARGAEQLEVAFATRRAADLAQMLQLVPGAAARAGGRAAVDGHLSATGKVRRSEGKTALEITADLRDTRIRQSGVGVSGAVTASAHAEVAGGNGTVEATLDLSAAAVDVAPALSKRAGHPARATFTVRREGDRVEVRDAAVILPGVTAEGITVDRDSTQVRVNVGTATVKPGSLAEMVPVMRGALPPALADATLQFKVELSTAAGDPSAASLRLPSFDLHGGFGHLNGTLEIDGLRPVRAVRLDVRNGDLDLSGFAQKDGGGEVLLSEGGPRVEAHVHLGSVKVHGETGKDLDADLTVDRGRLTVGAARVQALGGTIDVTRSYVDLSDIPEVELHAKAEGVDLAHLPQSVIDELRGRGSLALDLRGRGLDREQITRSLRGSAKLDVKGMHGKVRFEPKVSIVNPILGEIARKAAEKRRGTIHTIDLREASASLDIDAGKAKTVTPIQLKGDDFRAELSGTLGEGGALALDGKVEIMPHVIAEASKRKLIPVRPVPLKLRLFDDGTGRKLELLELRDTVAALAGALRNAVDNAAMPVP